MRSKEEVDAGCEEDFSRFEISQTMEDALGLKKGPPTMWLWDENMRCILEMAWERRRATRGSKLGFPQGFHRAMLRQWHRLPKVALPLAQSRNSTSLRHWLIGFSTIVTAFLSVAHWMYTSEYDEWGMSPGSDTSDDTPRVSVRRIIIRMGYNTYDFPSLTSIRSCPRY